MISWKIYFCFNEAPFLCQRSASFTLHRDSDAVQYLSRYSKYAFLDRWNLPVPAYHLLALAALIAWNILVWGLRFTQLIWCWCSRFHLLFVPFYTTQKCNHLPLNHDRKKKTEFNQSVSIVKSLSTTGPCKNHFTMDFIYLTVLTVTDTSCF